MAMDGCVLATAPTDDIERRNYCLHGETHMWRKKGEAALPELAGEDPYAEQVPLSRAIPFWGAISENGYCDVVYHKTKKLSTDEWQKDALASGKLWTAVRQLRHSRARPFRILCDNETFLATRVSRVYYESKGIELL